MAGIYPVDLVKKAAEDIAVIMNLVSEVVNHAGIFVLIQAIDPIKDLTSLNLAELKNQLLDMDDAEGAEVKAAFAAKLKLKNPAVQAKILASTDCVSEALDLVSEGLELFGKGKLLVEKVKNVFTVVP